MAKNELLEDPGVNPLLSFDAKAANSVIGKIEKPEYFIADKGYECEAIHDEVREAAVNFVIPRRYNSKH